MAANIGLNEGQVRASMKVLNNLLADHLVLLVKTWNFHWNVKGVSFHSYHVFMEDLYNGLIEDIDSIAERIRSLDERPLGSLADCLSHNRIKEHGYAAPLPEAKKMLAVLSEDNDTLIRELRKDIAQLAKTEDTDDAGTTNFLEDMIEKKEKIAWMIRAYLEK